MHAHIVQVAKQYGLVAHEVYACDTVYRREAAYRIVTDQGSFMLKPYLRSMEHLIGVYNRVEELRNRQYTNMPKWIKTEDGCIGVKYEGIPYYATEWIEGSPPGGELSVYNRLGEALANLHVLTRRNKPDRCPYTMLQIELFKQDNKQFTEQLQSLLESGEDKQIRWFRENGARCVELANEAWTLLEKPDISWLLKNERSSIVHGDLTRPNVIAGDSKVYLIDWEQSRRGSTYLELAKALQNIASSLPDYMRALLVGYEGILPLASVERRLIAAICHLPREAWLVLNKQSMASQSLVFEALKQSWNSRLEGIAWLDEWANSNPILMLH